MNEPFVEAGAVVTMLELDPQWVTVLPPDQAIKPAEILTFLCPHCKEWRLAIAREPVTMQEQHDAFERAYGENWNLLLVPFRPGIVWGMSGDPYTGTITPSVDASASGHWHGHIRNGVVE